MSYTELKSQFHRHENKICVNSYISSAYLTFHCQANARPSSCPHRLTNTENYFLKYGQEWPHTAKACLPQKKTFLD